MPPSRNSSLALGRISLTIPSGRLLISREVVVGIETKIRPIPSMCWSTKHHGSPVCIAETVRWGASKWNEQVEGTTAGSHSSAAWVSTRRWTSKSMWRCGWRLMIAANSDRLRTPHPIAHPLEPVLAASRRLSFFSIPRFGRREVEKQIYGTGQLVERGVRDPERQGSKLGHWTSR